jgi:hypothetical protein
MTTSLFSAGDNKMQTYRRRISALEQANPPADELTIIRRIVAPGHLDAEIHSLRDDVGNEWARQSGESEQELIDRAPLR